MLFGDSQSDCNDTGYMGLIDRYYESVVSCIYDVSDASILSRVCVSGYSEYVVPNWSKYMQYKHEAVRKAFLN